MQEDAWFLCRKVPSASDYGLLSEDTRLDRFSKHCLADMALAEELSPHPADWTLQSAVVLVSHGEASASQGWPMDPKPPSTWDCRPTDLPRHWHLNQQLHFQAVAQDGHLLERSFEPDLLNPEVAADDGEPWAGRSCAPNQLTSDGFKQAVRVGRRLAWRYGEALAEAALDVLSVDTKRSLATAVGMLLPLLAGPTSSFVVGEGTSLFVTTLEGSETLVHVEGGMEFALQDMQSGADLLSRWCNHGSLPCSADSCMTPKRAAEVIAQGELNLCRALVSSSMPALPYLQKAAQSQQQGRFSILSVSGIDLTASLVKLLGQEACEEVLMARPPWSSMLVFVPGKLVNFQFFCVFRVGLSSQL